MRSFLSVAFACLVVAAVSTSACAETFVSSADVAGPLLPHDPMNESVVNYNAAVGLYEDGKFDDALSTMRAAVRARRFSSTNSGFAYANLCLMYLAVGKFANAEAACDRALLALPNYVPALLNLQRARSREKPVLVVSAP